MSPLPDALEDRFPVEGSKFRRAVAEVDFNRNQEKQIVNQICLILFEFSDILYLLGWSFIPKIFRCYAPYCCSYGVD